MGDRGWKGGRGMRVARKEGMEWERRDREKIYISVINQVGFDVKFYLSLSGV